MADNSGRFNFIVAVVAPIVIVACCIAVGAQTGENAETLGTADPAEVAARLVVRLDTAVADLELAALTRVSHTGFCEAETFDAAPKDRYVVAVGYHYTPGVSAQNDHIIALYERWTELGWEAEIVFRTDGFARAAATDADDTFKARTDWRELVVSVTSPCYLFPGEPVWGEVTPADPL